ncbi:MAG: right-handed parallel beta-helix repeat-containing protein [Candidatus Omnitrophica bacterium]|nr:right-handed parallel beta-helix repeat-containing protein [Candidatus Omnitrophota bacterium]
MYIRCIVVPCILTFVLAIRTLACASDSPASFPGKIRLSVQGSTEHRSTYYADYLLALYYPKEEETLIFFNPKETIQDPSAEELNLGLGIRRIIAEKYILGVHFFYDKKHSHSRAWHYQRGYGLEFLSQAFDFRFNYYDPVNKPRVVNETYNFGQTNLIHYSDYEEPLEGFDIELGFPLRFKPLKTTRVYIGGYSYNSGLGKDKRGQRIRTETNFFDWLSLDLTYNNLSSNEGEFIGGVRFTIPIEPGRLLQGKNPIHNASRRPYIKERLFERVVRDIDVQTERSTKNDLTSDANGVIEMIYVDNTNNSGTEDGTLAHPYNTLAEALSSARYAEGKYVYLFRGDGTSNGYAGEFTLLDNVILWGSGYNGGYEGLPTSGYPIIDGGGGGAVITLGNNDTIMGCQIQNADLGIFGTDVSTIIKYNRITGNSTDGIYLRSAGGAVISSQILGNIIYDNDGRGIDIRSGATNASFVISGNTISGNTTSGIYITLTGNTTFNAKISRNTIFNNADGVTVSGSSTNPVTIDLGAGGLLSEGYNSIYGNSNYNVDNSVDGLTIKAENNWWGQSQPSAAKFNGNVDYDPWLTFNPN